MFEVVHPIDLEDGALAAGRLFTGVAGARFPHGLLVGNVRVHRDGRLVLSLHGADEWPRTLSVSGAGGGR